MNKRNGVHLTAGDRFPLLLLAVFLWSGIGRLSSRAAELTNSPPSADVQDLTGLSLEELYNLDVVQVNVLGGHTHPSGQAMFGYHFMYTQMDDYRKNSRHISDSEVLRDFPTIHTEMTMEMHMFEAMYAPSDRLTLMAMIPYHRMSMKHVRRTGMTFDTESEGIGDLQVMGLYTALGDIHRGQRLLLNGGVSFPTGSTDKHDTFLGARDQLEYRMQTGSGTYDFLPGLSYLGESERWSWGVQGLATLRFGRNNEGYRFGNQYRLTSWAAYGVTDWFAPSVRVDGHLWDNIHGQDPDINPLANPESDPDRQGGRRVDLLFGLNFYAPKGLLEGNRLMIEGGFPVYEYLDGPQLGTSWIITAGWSYSF